ncbi:hypothetical protein SZ52_01720 [Brachyspira hyodysenteriae]|uniref:hypothetical protein n=2 Tax=Brachyspira hyodysenteriae TaxID=159 RepID=UPI00063D8F3B|nr:hypothetical protein [Brachyspira hyodysenteriae]KLI44473.1 hypothetical protein SZ52_01720 [Brachyspira hyodysenteriae]
MNIQEIRIYSECLEQGLDFKDYFLNFNANFNIKNIYISKNKSYQCSSWRKILDFKKFDLVITIISEEKEIPILVVEYSTAVPTDDHKMQRSDVYFWGSIFKIPVMKISPLEKLSTSNGGGSKITMLQEINLSLLINSVVYFIDWKLDNYMLETNLERLSCIPYNEKIEKILNNILQKIISSNTFDEVYKAILNEQKLLFNNIEIEKLKKNFVNSTRFQNSDSRLIVKINRFGHAMDPDRGVLFFVNMLFEGKNIISKLIIKRECFDGKESYKALFDGLSKYTVKKLNKIIENDINGELALKIFQVATNTESLKIEKKTSYNYEITDKNLIDFLDNYKNIVYKSIFINSTKLQLCDYEQNILCEITWNKNIIKNYLKKLYPLQYESINISKISFSNTKEDIITYASVQLLKKAGCDILAVSYPGAQGDKAILIGNGRKTKRIYIDIISYKKSNKILVLLHENKINKNDLKKDEIKLLELKENNINEINTLLNKFSLNNITNKNVYLGLGSKSKLQNNISTYLKADYIFAFDIKSDSSKTHILWNIAIINLDLLELFKPLVNKNNKLEGEISLNSIYTM